MPQSHHGIHPSNRPPPLPLGTSHDLRVGQSVYAIGNPFGLDWTLTRGIVSALDRALDNDDGTTIEHLIQTDAAINPGNSGGPLLDSAGRLIGMNTAIYSPSGASAGIGFAVPIDTINRVATALVANGKYAPPSLGIETDPDLNDFLSERLNVEGVFVLRVRPRGPAAAAGLRGARVEQGNVIVPGDVIVSVGGKPVDTVAKLQSRLDDFNPGEMSADVDQQAAPRESRLVFDGDGRRGSRTGNCAASLPRSYCVSSPG